MRFWLLACTVLSLVAQPLSGAGQRWHEFESGVIECQSVNELNLLFLELGLDSLEGYKLYEVLFYGGSTISRYNISLKSVDSMTGSEVKKQTGVSYHILCFESEGLIGAIQVSVSGSSDYTFLRYTSSSPAFAVPNTSYSLLFGKSLLIKDFIDNCFVDYLQLDSYYPVSNYSVHYFPGGLLYPIAQKSPGRLRASVANPAIIKEAFEQKDISFFASLLPALNRSDQTLAVYGLLNLQRAGIELDSTLNSQLQKVIELDFDIQIYFGHHQAARASYKELKQVIMSDPVGGAIQIAGRSWHDLYYFREK